MMKEREHDGESVGMKLGMAQESGRREFLQWCGRWTVLALGAAVGTRFLRRNQVSVARQRCVNDGICSSCGTYSVCDLPQALTRRRTIQGRDDA